MVGGGCWDLFWVICILGVLLFSGGGHGVRMHLCILRMRFDFVLLHLVRLNPDRHAGTEANGVCNVPAHIHVRTYLHVRTPVYACGQMIEVVDSMHTVNSLHFLNLYTCT